ncbi:FAD binding domain protein [Xylaria sp. FL1777]|nr:FAD binding domain protein [Xylaria sp. FL1777]
MEVAITALSWALSLTCRSLPEYNGLLGICPQQDIATELGARVSSGTQIFLPGSPEYSQATTRWSAFNSPEFNVVVVPGVESDVAEIVKYANSQDISYMAVNSGHGSIKTLGKFKGGIEIWLDKLSSVEIAADGETAKIGGGTWAKTITDVLWAQGKQTVTGACECTSLLGPGLGGGHGILQGRYGLISDQFVSMNIVLANGDLQTIDKESDLWWAMQGAGHNFGIVTSVTSKIYDVQYPDWAYASFIFTGDKVESLYEAINEHFLKNDTQPVYILDYSFFFNEPAIDPENPLLMFFVLQEGAQAVDPVYTKIFNGLGPIVTDAGAGSYKQIPAWTGIANESPQCQKAGLVTMRFPIDLQTYNVTAQRKAYDLFASAMKETPDLKYSALLFEGFSLHGVKAVPDEQSAFPSRGDNLLVAPSITYAPSTPELEEAAVNLGESLRQILYEGSGRTELHSYVNYAFGEETLENWYGYDEWRQTRLRELKKKYDPLGKFSFYAPIPLE